jgi:hypothetical protein
MNATILNGALTGDCAVDAVNNILKGELTGQGWQVRSWPLREEKIAFCLGCFECWVKSPGLCRIDDVGRDVAESVIASDLAIYLTPITFGGYSSELKKAIDRSICLISPFFQRIDGEVHHHARYKHFPRLLGVGVLPAPDAEQEEIFRTLVSRNAINMHASAQQALVLYNGQSTDEISALLQPVLFEGRVLA